MTNSATKLTDEQLKYWLAWARIKKIGPVRWQKLINYFPNMEMAWRAGRQELLPVGLGEQVIAEIIATRSMINPDEELSNLKKENINIVTIIDEEYPWRLKQIYDAPPILFYRGSLDCLSRTCIAVVGTRKYSPYGEQVTEEITAGLCRHGLTIVSGLALGIDALAHQVTLKNNGLTAGILGSSVDWQNVYPSSNRYLAQKIIDSGGIVASEYPINTSPAKYTFPERNRIVSGLSWGVLVIEAPESSGALITAKIALEQNREVLAVPGNIFNHNSVGTNNLIKQGAKVITKAEDVLEELDINTLEQLPLLQPEIKISPDEQEILKLLSKEPTHIDNLAKTSKIRINVLLSTLTMLEMKGVIKDMGGKNYIIK
ncbi:MAG: DNA-processing protein DprA [bacterium]